MKWTRQRCQVAFRIRAAAALRPLWSSEITSLTPRRPRRVSDRKNSVQPFDWLRSRGLRGADRHAQHLAPSLGVDGDGDDHRDRDDPASLAHLDVSGVEPEVGPVALERAIEKGPDLVVKLRT